MKKSLSPRNKKLPTPSPRLCKSCGKLSIRCWLLKVHWAFVDKLTKKISFNQSLKQNYFVCWSMSRPPPDFIWTPPSVEVSDGT